MGRSQGKHFLLHLCHSLSPLSILSRRKLHLGAHQIEGPGRYLVCPESLRMLLSHAHTSFSLLLPCWFLFCACFNFLLLPQLFGKDYEGLSSDVAWGDSGMGWKETGDLSDIVFSELAMDSAASFLEEGSQFIQALRNKALYYIRLTGFCVTFEES